MKQRSVLYKNTIFVFIGSLLIIAIFLRVAVIPIRTYDYIAFVHPWTNFIRDNGFHAFRYSFANYNAPYLGLLYLGTLLHLPTIFIVKGISIVFDLVLAYAVYLVVGYFKPDGYQKWFAGIAVLYLPTVYLNSSVWGQCDSIYASFVIFSLYNGLKDRSKLAWMLWGFSMAFKLQAIFFLPFLLFLHIKKHWQWWTSLTGPVIFAVLSMFPVLAGQDIASTLSVYWYQITQTNLRHLSIYAATIYQWFPGGSFSLLQKIGLLMDGMVVAGLLVIASSKKQFSQQQILILCACSVLAIPFLLPQMHERYFYVAEITMFIAGCVHIRLLWIPLMMQLLTVASYIPYLSSYRHGPFIPFWIMSTIIFALIVILAWYAFSNYRLPQKAE